MASPCVGDLRQKTEDVEQGQKHLRSAEECNLAELERAISQALQSVTA